jgi:hypothetical protein
MTRPHIPKRGFMWRTWGFTRLHIWGLNVVGGIIIGVGAGAATLATLGVLELPDNLFWRLAAIAACASLLCIAMALGSIFGLLFYSGSARLGLLGSEPDNVNLLQATP